MTLELILSFFVILLVAYIASLFQKQAKIYSEMYDQVKKENMELLGKYIKAVEANRQLQQEINLLKDALND